METLNVRFPTIQTLEHRGGTPQEASKGVSRVMTESERSRQIQKEDQRILDETRHTIDGAEGPVEVVVDLRGSTFVNSSRLGVIMRIRQSAEAKGGRVAALVDSEAVRSVMSVTKLDKLIDVRGE
jgi:anti-anti-sigma factor